MRTLRAQNLYIARAIFGTQVEIAQRINKNDHNLNSTLTRQANGSRQITDDDARHYEEKLGLPKGWFDRDNMMLLKVTGEEYRLFEQIHSLVKE